MENYLSDLKVLYIEDEEEILVQMSRFLKKRIGKVTSFDNAEDALREIERDSYDVLITDLRMPGTDGIELISKVREKGIKIPIIITSAFSDTETILSVINLGIVKYLIKPIKTSELISYLSEVNEEKTSMAKIGIRKQLGQLTKEVRVEMEKAISSEIAFFQKSTSGKGPRTIQVLISSVSVEIKIIEPYTMYEIALIKNERNVEFVSYGRQRFYRDYAQKFSDIVKRAIKFDVKLAEIKSSPLDGVDCLVFHLV